MDNKARRSALVGLLVLTLSACGAGDGTNEQAASSPAPAAVPGVVAVGADGVQELTIQVSDDYVFTPATVTVAPRPLRLTVQSVADELTHGFRFTPGGNPQDITEEISVIGPGRSETVEFEVDEAGDYLFDCSFHIGMGQTGVMTVAAD
ncbi:hypothetical protein E9549_10280 [Blastococcus sp. MG754426]|uniref:plastocyanin/azurin family copper-binding protein n=1 Tax=Blastococcus sp. KM273129 TaxID=2570315 RepID=UPI001F1CC67A|nr:plastocyanin/azurin family copper-binding protein [Blastococcus sp. KM273129]MCF6507786.1 hypothetical protein [Blastococcus sp. MG754426]MCF6510207.1 hypothetical protein [Blastococcus sp. MG754427]MCF6735873.1 hypothetical protein [Blastococcus sp. KM273129]